MVKKVLFYVHWFLGLSAGAVLMVVATSGALLSFEKEILSLLNASTLHVKAQERPLTAEALIQTFLSSTPSNIVALSLSNDKTASAQIFAQRGDDAHKENRLYYVNPYTGEVLPELQGRIFFKTVLDLHRRLLLGDTGKQMVGASTLSLLVLIMSGMYLYWGSIRRHFFSSLKVNTRLKGRGFLYQLHSAVGLWVTLPFLLIALTGLSWSYEWYKGTLYAMFDFKKEKRVKQMGVEQNSLVFDGTINRAWSTFQSTISYESATLKLPIVDGRAEFNYFDINAPHSRSRNMVVIDVNSSKILSHNRYEEKRMGEKILSSMLPLHSGEFFGIVGRGVIFIASISMLLLGITALKLYLDRRRKRAKKLHKM